MCCGRCGVPLSSNADDAPTDAPQSAHPAEIGLDLDAPPASPGFEDWQLDHSVRSLRARMEPWQTPPGPHRRFDSHSRQAKWRVDAAHQRTPGPHEPRRRSGPRRSRRRGPTFTNSALVLGLLAATSGAGVLGYSVAEGRGDLWNVGLSAVVAGSVVFLLGLVLQLERIWHNSRFAIFKLRQIDNHLQDLERTTASLGVTHGAPSGAFYSHMAEEANPHLLLSDLKGQIDLLAMNLARR